MDVTVVAVGPSELGGAIAEIRMRALESIGVVEFVAGLLAGAEDDWEFMKSFITWADNCVSLLAQTPDPQALGWQLCDPQSGWQWFQSVGLDS